MKISMNFYAHLERNSPNIYQSDKSFEQTLQVKLKHKVYIQYEFSVCVTAV
jgi:hypothetical protein